MSEIGDIFAILKEAKKDKKKANIEHSTYLILDKDYSVDIKNNGVHLIVKHNDHTVDFWPSTGKFIFRNSTVKGRGVKRLIKELER